MSSYLAFPSLPRKARRFLSVALSLGSPPAAVSIVVDGFLKVPRSASGMPAQDIIIQKAEVE